MSSQQRSTGLATPETHAPQASRNPLGSGCQKANDPPIGAPRLIEGNFLPWLCFSLHTIDIRSGETEKNPVPRSPPPTVRQWGLTARPPAAPGPGSPQDLPGPLLLLLLLLQPRATPLHAPERARDSPGRAGDNGARTEPRAPTPARRATLHPAAAPSGRTRHLQPVHRAPRAAVKESAPETQA